VRELAQQTAFNSVPMASATILAFLGLAILLLDIDFRSMRPSEHLAISAQYIILLAVIAFAYAKWSAQPPVREPRIAVHTLLAFTCLVLSVLLARPDRGVIAILANHQASGLMARRLLPIALAVPLVAGWGVLAWSETAARSPILAVSLTVLFSSLGLSVLVWWKVRVLHSLDLQRAAAEEARARSEWMLKRAQRIAQLGSWEANLETGATIWSEETRRIFEVARETPVSRETIFRAVHPDDVECVREHLAAAESATHPLEWEYRIVSTGGTVRTLLSRTEVIRGQSGEQRLIGTVQDVTDRRALEERLRQAQKMDAIGQLAGGIAHDFNNLLTVIQGYVDLVIAQGNHDSTTLYRLTEIRKGGERAAALTNQLLAFGRKQVLSPKVVDLSAALNEMDGILQRLLGPGIEIRTSVGRGLGCVFLDQNQFEQVILNLALNARDAMPQGGRLTIELKNQIMDQETAESRKVAPGPYVMVAVSDTGVGMAPEIQERVFEPFFTTKGPGKGTGLGLAVVHGIVSQSGGCLSCYSQPGHGTVFRIWFPRVAGLPEEVTPTWRQAPPGGTETVLLVEDDLGIRKLVSVVLKDAGYLGLEAEDLESAIAQTRRHDGVIHLIISDLALPKFSGRQVVEAVRAARPDVRVLFVSGSSESALEHQGRLATGEAFLSKPFTPEQLLTKVREVLDGTGRVASRRATTTA
jgi:PAS domain S-box-containing protein